MPFNEKTGNSKEIAFVTAPNHVYIELQKLNGIEVTETYFLLKNPHQERD